ncbi:serine protease nudel [Armigeres subalbatus]|uniref:serine protease nudel n=1 Tax=Armigeres subalbatus TaxID=124917 RepID=UPI002ECFF236
MERGGMKKSKECKTTSSKTESDQQRSAFPDSIVDTLFEEYGRPPPPFHEDQLDQPKLPVEVHDFIMGRSRNRDQFNHDLPAPIESTDSRTFKYSPQPTVAASGPFLNLCDQLRSQQNPTPVKTLTSNQQHFQAQQFGALGQTSIPITGESHKATSQVLLNSAYGGFNPNHFCFYQVPPTYGAMRPVYAGGQSYPAGVMNVPVNIHNLPGRRTGDDADLDGAQLLCSLVVPPSTEKSALGNDSVALKATQDLDDVSMMTGARARGHHRHCPRGKVPCADGVQCVLSSHLCDSRVDCFDGSDETHCSCLSRLPEIRRCDGYVDCPLGEDEIGCFSCDKFSFSCFNTFFEFQASHHSETKCFTLIEKCDGFSNCLNGKDEQDCTMLVRDLRSPLAFTVGHSVGILHRNYKGKWYPVCHNPLSLAKEACEAELGPSHRDPVIVQHHGDLPGPFIQPNLRSHHVFQPEFTDTCNGLINYVKCPPPKCGSTKQSEMENVRIKIRGKRNASEILQIVGGTKAESGAYPFIVGIFRDGKFHCGSSIFNEHWIITAAHCCDNFHRHHYELRAGLLRRRSFSPHVQISTATHVLIHHGYSPQKMINDIALMHSDRPFQYNRWVRPICLPERHMTTNDRDWIWGPKPGTMCTAIGWGALVEHGGSPDHLMHVTVPILPFCKHKNDRDGLGICAAEMGGGHDACQGDSGGPFVCVSVSSPHEWYLAGVVSHGEGCARPNEPGVYTRVALFNEWIIKKTSEMLPPSNTRLTCPGFQCSFGVSYCIAKKKRCNGKVDCLGGEDELNCSLDQLLAESVKETSTVISLANRTTTSSTSTAVTGTTTPKIDFLAETSDQSSTTPYVTRPTTSTAPTEETVQTTPRTDAGTLNVTHLRKITEAYTTEHTTAANMTTRASDENSSSSEENEETTTTITQTVTSAMDANISNSTTESVTTSVSTTTSSTSTSTISEIKFSTLNYSAAISTEQTTSSPTVDYATITTNHTSYSISSTESSDVISSTEHYLKVDYSAVIEPTTETTLHTSQSEIEVTSATSEILSDKPNATVLSTSTMSSVVDNNATTVNSYEADKTSESRYLESSTTETSVSFTTDSISSTTNQSDYFYNSTTKMSMSSNSPNTSRDSASDDLVGSSPTESPPDPSSTTTDSTSSTTAAHRDLEHSETQIETIETKAVHTTTDEHPFLSEIHQLVEKKNSRLKQFRLSMHYLHTSLKNQTTATNETVFRNKRFVCSKIHQSINIAHYCDRIIDCEDGTDEQRCTCRDYLTDKYDFLICDGKTDCLDLTDEENCFSCETGQYPCRMSKVCIDESKLCDTIPDCPLHEDELDCLALTDGNKVYFDANNLTEFKYEGLATKNTNGTWNLICGMQVDNKSVESIGKICSFLGFAGYRSYYQTVFEPLKNDTVDLEHQPLLIMSYRNISSEPQCKALHIACVPFINATEHEISHYENQHKEKPVQVNIRPVNPIDTMSTKPHITFHENDHIEFIENFGDDYDWPWNADIYLEGVFLCSAIIIDVNWIVVDSSCMRLINLKNDYLSVVTGGAKSYLKISGPYEQIVRVDCYHFLPEARVVMLHLEKNLTYTRHVLPTFIPEKSHNIEDNQCLAVGQDKYGRTRTLRVHINMTHCGHQPEKHICYQLDPNKGTYHADHCYTEGATRSGVVVCKTVLSGWYPVGFYLNKHGLCGFNEVVKMISLKEFYTDIQHVLGNKQCDYTFPEPLCDGMRCRYGKCIGHSLVCDNKMDCYDNSDERPEACNARNDTSTACLPTQFRCGEHQCVDKSKFCDGRNDCGDLSDEPHECSCYTYLKVTQPSTICDGIRNCWDKSDENPRLCKCTNSTFQCGDSEICVPYDHVCDGDNDCPGKEDEQFCYALQQNKAETNYGEVMQQTHGIWHSKCFPKNDKYDNQTIKEICNRIGYLQVRKVFGMKMLHESRLRTDNRTHDPVDRLRSAATKAVVLNQFSKVAINGKQKFFMKPSRPLFTLVNWDAEDEQNCDRLQISCEE